LQVDRLKAFKRLPEPKILEAEKVEKGERDGHSLKAEGVQAEGVKAGVFGTSNSDR
jgi:hypothetical protein